MGARWAPMIGVYLKTFWMAFWRLALIFTILDLLDISVFVLFGSVALTYYIVKVKRLDPQIFPLRKRLKGRPAFLPLAYQSTERPTRPQPRPPVQPDVPNPRRRQERPPHEDYEQPVDKTDPRFTTYQDRPSSRGRVTPYEPATLQQHRPLISSRSFGVAGHGLLGGAFSNAHAAAGRTGEIGFYKSLSLGELLDEFHSYWSVAMPAPEEPVRPDTKFTTDVDCIIATRTQIILIDLKYYSRGAVEWYSEGATLFCRDETTGQQVGEPIGMSRNMVLAQQRFGELFPTMQVEACVVFIPTAQGLGTVRPGTAWPGGMPALDLLQMLDRLRATPPGVPSGGVHKKLLLLLKND